MADTYCGKSCEKCELKKESKCSGCKVTPFGLIDQARSKCEIASCCKKEECIVCTNCRQVSACRLYANRDGMPQKFAHIATSQGGSTGTSEGISTEASRDYVVDEYEIRKAQRLRDWMEVFNTALFAFLIIGVVGTIITAFFSSFALIDSLLIIVGMIVMIVALFKLGDYEDGYNRAAVFQILAIVASFLRVVFFVLGASPVFSLMCSTATTVFGIIALINEVKAHSEILRKVDSQLSAKWDKYLSMLYVSVGIGVVCFAAYVLALFSSSFGCLLVPAVLVLSVAIIVLAIMRLVYIVLTMKALQRYYYNISR